MRKNIIILITAFTLANVFVYLFTKYSKRPSCSLVVFLDGELSRDADDIKQYGAGVTWIKYCDGTEVQIPSTRIVRIVEK
jgi:hypothetical protein